MNSGGSLQLPGYGQKLYNDDLICTYKLDLGLNPGESFTVSFDAFTLGAGDKLEVWFPYYLAN